jgi:hypothetical protein
MLILLTIFLLVFTPVVMLVVYLVRPKFSIQGFLAVLAVFSGWIIVLFARQDIPDTITLLQWLPARFFPDTPALFLDDISWYFSLAVITLGLSSMVTSMARLGHSKLPNANFSAEKTDVLEDQNRPGEGISPTTPRKNDEKQTTSSWQSWAGILSISGLGLVAVTAGNLLTMLLAWVSLDLIELLILLSQAFDNELQKRVTRLFSLRMAGIGIVLLAGIDSWSQGMSFTFDNIYQTSAMLLILAACLRLSTIAIQFPFIYAHPQKHELGTILRLVLAAASYILVVRVAEIGILGSLSPILLAAISLVGIFASICWMYAENDSHGTPYWLIGTASLAIASAILKHPAASITWSIASLLTGGLIFSLFIHSTALIPITLIGFLGFSALPFSPTWLGMNLYTLPEMTYPAIPRYYFYLLPLVFLVTHSLLLAGYIRQALRGVFPRYEIKVHIERWVWFIFPVGLLFIIAAHIFIGILLLPESSSIPAARWIMGAVTVLISGVIWYVHSRYGQVHTRPDQQIKKPSLLKQFLLEGFSRLFDIFFHSLSRLFTLISTILEGDGGILWAFVLFALILVFLLR